MIEVLHVIDTYRIGGPGKTIINSARWIDPGGWHLHVAAFTHPDTSRNEFARAVRAAGIPFLELRETRRVNVDHVGQLRRYVRDAGIRIVHTHGYRSDLLGYVATRGFRRPRIVTTHHGWIRNNPRQDLMTRLVLRLCQRFDGVEVVSDMLRRELPPALQQSPRTAVVHNAVVVEDYAASGARDRVRAELGLGPGDPLLGVFGRISIEKGCLEMIEALAQVVAMRPNVRLAFIGEGPLVAEVRARVDAAGLAGAGPFPGTPGADAASSRPSTCSSLRRELRASPTSSSKRWRAAPPWWPRPWAARPRSSSTARADYSSRQGTPRPCRLPSRGCAGILALRRASSTAAVPASRDISVSRPQDAAEEAFYERILAARQ